MDTRAMREGIRTDNRFVRLHGDPHRSADTAANRDDLFRVNFGVIFFEIVPPSADCHDDFFE